MHEKHTGGALMGFIAGAAVGAALGALLAPRSGREIRGAIGARYQSSAERARELAGMAKEQARVAHERITALTPS